jgi:hypothetical protein
MAHPSGRRHEVSCSSSPTRAAACPLVHADNSDPAATDVTFNVTEDSCTALPDLTQYATDWNGTGWNRDSLTAVVTSTPSRGTLYSDSNCETAATNPSGVTPTSLYYKAPHNEFSYSESAYDPTPSGVNGVLTTLAWSVSDGQGGSDTASLAIRVVSVNDAPIALPSQEMVFMAIPKRITVNGPRLPPRARSRRQAATPPRRYAATPPRRATHSRRQAPAHAATHPLTLPVLRVYQAPTSMAPTLLSPSPRAPSSSLVRRATAR